MAESKKAAAAEEAKAAVDPNNELVEYTAPLLGVPNKRDIIVGVNGELIRIKRGETVMIRRKFLKVLQQAAEQEMAAYRTMEQAQKQGERAMASM